MGDDRCWEVVGAINGNCVYVKRDITQIEAKNFMYNAKADEVYFWPDGEAIRVLGGTCAFWARRTGNGG